MRACCFYSIPIMSTLYFTQPYSFLTADTREFAVVEDDRVLKRIPITEVEQIVVFQDCNLSKLAVRIAYRWQIPLIYIGDRGRTMARVEPEDNPLYLTQQRESLREPEFCFQLAQSLLQGRCHNGIAILLEAYAHHTHQILEKAISKLQQYLDALPTLTHLAQVKALVEAIAPIYRLAWHVLGCEQGMTFNGEPSYDLAYALLSQEFYRLLRQTGCSPHLGTLHPHCQNHLPLPCDLMEPFRPLVERWVLQVGNSLDDLASIEQWPGFLQMAVTHPYGGTMSLQECLRWQVDEYVVAITQGTAYRPFLLVG